MKDDNRNSFKLPNMAEISAIVAVLHDVVKSLDHLEGSRFLESGVLKMIHQQREFLEALDGLLNGLRDSDRTQEEYEHTIFKSFESLGKNLPFISKIRNNDDNKQ